jgi:hypothetical protein
MKLLTWNIQWCRGCDGRVDPRRIVDDARAFADFDVLCVQEVAANFSTWRAARARTSSRCLPGCCPASPRSPRRRSTSPAPKARAGNSAT